MNKKSNSATVSYTWLPWVLAIVAFLLYARTIGYEYTMDDDIFFLKHRSVQQGLSGTAEIFTRGSMELFDNTKGVQAYRPVNLFFYAVEKSFVGTRPGFSHAVNVLLYALVSVFLFRVLQRLLRDLHPLWIGAMVLLYVLNPLHTEVVASVKSRDELWAALFAFIAWDGYIRWIDTRKLKYVWVGVSAFLLASFSKESTVAWVAVFPLSVVLFRRLSIREALLPLLPYVGVSLFYVMVRFLIVGTETDFFGIPILANILTGATNAGELWATRFELIGHYLKMAVWPWPLSWDYSYNAIPVMSWTKLWPWVSAIVHVSVVAMAVVRFRKSPLLSFAVFFFLITLSPVNNFFILNTTTFGERLMFVPSLAVGLAWISILAGSSGEALSRSPLTIDSWRRYLLFTLLLVFAGLTWMRTPDWKDNYRLFQSGVEVCPESSRTHYAFATECHRLAMSTNDPVKRAEYLATAGEHFQRSVDILPTNHQAFYNYALYSSFIGDTARSIDLYRQTVILNPNYLEAWNNLGTLYLNRHEFDSAVSAYSQVVRLSNHSVESLNSLANVHFNRGIDFAVKVNEDSAMVCYRRAVDVWPSHVMAINNIASLYASRQQYDSCLHYLKRASDLEPTNLMVLENIAAVSYLAKSYEQGVTYAQRALAIQPDSRKSLTTLVNCYNALGNSQEASRNAEKLNRR